MSEDCFSYPAAPQLTVKAHLCVWTICAAKLIQLQKGKVAPSFAPFQELINRNYHILLPSHISSALKDNLRYSLTAFIQFKT